MKISREMRRVYPQGANWRVWVHTKRYVRIFTIRLHWQKNSRLSDSYPTGDHFDVTRIDELDVVRSMRQRPEMTDAERKRVSDRYREDVQR